MNEKQYSPLFIDTTDAEKSRKRNNQNKKTPDYKYSKKKDLNRKKHNKKKPSLGVLDPRRFDLDIEEMFINEVFIL